MNSERNKIAVIGMACRFPGANNLDEYWQNLINAKETIKHFEDSELRDFEIEYDKLKDNPNFVPARGILDNIDKFDADFFGMSPREASITDPQHRVWFETVWTAFENAGCNPHEYKGNIGVYAGAYANTYLLNNVLRDPEKYENYIRLRTTESFQINTANDITHLPSKTAYFFNLKGPAVNTQTACSTSLVAIAQACNSLYSFESDICVAGGICIMTPQESGYIYQEGAIPSPDGHCRPFDERGQGTVFSNGVGVVVLKRIEDALRENDHIYAVVDGWALNNDGNKKVSYTAPSVQGQEEVILMAQAFAGIKAEEIGYIEAHGTATTLGDPIEIKALTNAFTKTTNKKQFCGIGSVKSNIGHTDAAAGVAAFIKVCLAAYHKTIPSTLNYKNPNIHINFEESPFYVNNKLEKWVRNKKLIMGVSSFGIGGTNAHIIVEEPLNIEKEVRAVNNEELVALPISAKSKIALKNHKEQLINFLNENKYLSLNDIAYTLWTGREHMVYRSVLFASSITNNITINDYSIEGKFADHIKGYTFMFPGQGAHFVNMGKSLYVENTDFKKIVDHGFSIFKKETGNSLKDILFPKIINDASEKALTNTLITQSALFIIEFALAKILIEEGISPNYLIGHSIGEYAAASISGVFDFETALKIVIKRGQLMQSMPSGTMFAVNSNFQTLNEIRYGLFEVAAENAPERCTISFQTKDLEQVIKVLDENNIMYIQLNTSHAFHSKTFDPIMEEFAKYVDNCKVNTPQIPVISCLTGDFISDEDAVSGKYWAKQLRNTVCFSKGVSKIQSLENTLFIEVGPNSHLTANIRASALDLNTKTSILTLGRPEDNNGNSIQRIKATIWCYTSQQFDNFYSRTTGSKKVSLPTYPFEKKSFWIEHKNKQNSETISKLSSDLTVEFKDDNHLMNTLLSIWKKHIGRDDIKITDSFHDIGGQSLLAFSIIADIEKLLNVKISFHDFMAESSSVISIGKLIEIRTKIQREGNKESFISNSKLEHSYSMQPHGNKTPIFAIYSEKALTSGNDFGTDRPIYDFVWPGVNGRPFPMNTVEEIAKIYLHEILLIYPSGPFYLIGFSIGGLIAYEIALKLQEMGFEVPILFLIDVKNPQLKFTQNQYYLKKIKIYRSLKIIAIRSLNVLKQKIKDKAQKTIIYVFFKLNKKLPGSLTQTMIYNESLKIASRYNPRSYNGKIHLFKSELNLIDDEFLGWKYLVSDISTSQLKGGHTDAVRENVNISKIIKKLKKMISEVEN